MAGPGVGARPARPPSAIPRRGVAPCVATRLAPAVAAAALNLAFVALLLGTGRISVALALAFVPACGIVAAALVASDRSILAFGALGLGISIKLLNTPLVGGSLFAADVVAVLALVAWVVARLLGRAPAARAPGAPGVREAAVLFVLFWGIALVRGHEQWGQKLYGEPLRLVLYAAVGLSLVELTPRKTHRRVVAVLYAGTVWMLLNTLYLMATGGSATDSSDLSTGGTRTVSLTVAMYLASALYLALLNLELTATPRAAAPHLLIAGIALFQIVMSFGRTTFLALVVVVPLILLRSRRVRRALGQLLPVAAPVVLAAVVLVTIASPSIPATLVARLNVAKVADDRDASVDWRLTATHEIMKQFHSSPFLGVGFGKGASFTLNGSDYEIEQDPHDSYVWLLAAGGIALLGSFALLVLACCAGAVSRLRGAAGVERVLVLWSLASLFTFLLNVAAGPMLSTPSPLLTIWLLLLLPLAMRRPAPAETEPAERPRDLDSRLAGAGPWSIPPPRPLP